MLRYLCLSLHQTMTSLWHHTLWCRWPCHSSIVPNHSCHFQVSWIPAALATTHHGWGEASPPLHCLPPFLCGSSMWLYHCDWGQLPIAPHVPQQHPKDKNPAGNGQLPSASPHLPVAQAQPHQHDQHCHHTHIVDSSQWAPQWVATYKTVRSDMRGYSLPSFAPCLFSVAHPTRLVHTATCCQHRSIPVQYTCN